jgi:hypothetical protein
MSECIGRIFAHSNLKLSVGFYKFSFLIFIRDLKYLYYVIRSFTFIIYLI